MNNSCARKHSVVQNYVGITHNDVFKQWWVNIILKMDMFLASVQIWRVDKSSFPKITNSMSFLLTYVW